MSKTKRPEEITKPIEQWTGVDFLNESSRLLGEDLDSPSVRIGAAMLAAVVHGPNLNKCAAAIDVGPRIISEQWTRLVQNRVFHNGKVYAGWLDAENGGLAFIVDVCVANGMLNRAKASPSRKVKAAT